jgi:1,4-alpha-glucan branching enzyme
VVTIAEESTAWPGVTRDSSSGEKALGFTFKWDMGWMNDTLTYFQHEHGKRQEHQDELTFASAYRKQECFFLPLSHDEVVHEKRSLLNRMPGDEQQRFANLRVLYGYQWMYAGKQLFFMGGELGQRNEWDHDGEIDWDCLNVAGLPRDLQRWVSDLNRLYREEPAFWAGDFDEHGFFWVDCSDHAACVLSFVRQTPDGSRQALVLLNLMSSAHDAYRVGLPQAGVWREVLNSDSEHYGGNNDGNGGGVYSQDVPWQNQPWSADFLLPSLSCSVFLHG